MFRQYFIVRPLALLLAITMAVLATPVPVFAAMVTTDRVVEKSAAAAEREEILDLLSRDGVISGLRDMGVDPDEAAARVQSMSDAEIAAFGGQLNQLAAGQGFHNSLVVVLLLVIILVLLI